MKDLKVNMHSPNSPLQQTQGTAHLYTFLQSQVPEKNRPHFLLCFLSSQSFLFHFTKPSFLTEPPLASLPITGLGSLQCFTVKVTVAVFETVPHCPSHSSSTFLSKAVLFSVYLISLAEDSHLWSSSGF